MTFPVCQWMEDKFRDVPPSQLAGQFSKDLHYPLWVHCIQAFGYREDWADFLWPHLRWDKRQRPYFPPGPVTPEAHRHKFLCVLTLSANSPGHWKFSGREWRSEDFVAPILDGTLENWGDGSLYPDPSWTWQFLSSFCDERGQWRGKETPLPQSTRAFMERYFLDFGNGDIHRAGKTIFVESGLHAVEALNKLMFAQAAMPMPSGEGKTLGDFFPAFKEHVLKRLKDALVHTLTLIQNPQWPETSYAKEALGLAISNLLVTGHLMECCLHPRGRLRASWNGEEKKFMRDVANVLSKFMEHFFDPRVPNLMDETQKKAHSFPLFHAYHALRLSESLI